jgi:hypothetical protein
MITLRLGEKPAYAENLPGTRHQIGLKACVPPFYNQ